MRQARAATVVALVLILGATVVPTEAVGGATTSLCVFCGSRGLADFILNIGLYLPLGIALAALGWRWLVTVAVGGALSLGVEVLQIFVIGGRDASLGDLLSNTTGVAAGWLVAAAWTRRSAVPAYVARMAPSAAVLVALAVLTAGLFLLRPAFPESRYYLQWTAEFGNMDTYAGEVLATRVGPLDLTGPPGPIAATDSVRGLLQAGAPVEADIRAGPQPARLAPIVSVYDDRQREIFLLATARGHVVYRYRRLGARFKLDNPQLRFRHVLDEAEPGELATVRVTLGREEHCATVGERTGCVLAFGAADTWALLSYWHAWDRALLGSVWLAVLFAPAGLVGSRWRDRGVAAGLAMAGLALGPELLGFAQTGVDFIGAAMVGLAAGGGVAEIVDHRDILTARLGDLAHRLRHRAR